MLRDNVEIKDKIREILPRVQKPARYTGGEYNAAIPKDDGIRVAFCFPDLYDVGMSNLGLRILYGLLNDRADTSCDRVFAPWPDMEDEMRRAGVPLFGLESQLPIWDNDMFMVTLQYEMSYTNVINLLDLAGIEPLAERRHDGPFVIGGGPCTYNPEPLADFFDFFLIGEGEEAMGEIVDAYATWEASGAPRDEYLKTVAQIPGIYVPKFYDVAYNPDGTIKSITPNTPEAPASVTKRIVEDFDAAYSPEKIVVPFVEIVHDRIVLEVFRGCDRGCRFCQAGMIYRPVRERSAETLLNQARTYIDDTGYEEISLASLSTSDYNQFGQLCEGLLEMTEGKNVNISLPSLRVDNFTVEIMQKVQKVRKSGLTFAPEAGTQRLRDVINKNITEDDLAKSAQLAFSGGWNGVKLYFMLGLPTENDQDIEGIARLTELVGDQYFALPKDKRPKGLRVNVSTSTFVPKPHTPFQWEAQLPIPEIMRRQTLLKNLLTRRWANYHYHEAGLSVLEGAFARGDRRLGKVLLAAHRLGCKFDGWSEWFDADKWRAAFEEAGLDPSFYTSRERPYEEILPWDHIDCGVRKDFLVRESEKARRGETTRQCRYQCTACGHEEICAGAK